MGFERFGGMHRSADPGSIPPHRFHLLVNARLTPAGLQSRPGLALHYDSETAECITALIETGEGQPAGALLSYPNRGYYREHPIITPTFTHQGRFSIVDYEFPLNIQDSPLAVVYDSGITKGVGDVTDRSWWTLGSENQQGRKRAPFIFDNKVCWLEAGVLYQITDVKRVLDPDNSTGKLQLLANIFDSGDDAGLDVVVRQENDPLDNTIRDVLYTPSTTAGELLRYDGTTSDVVSTGAAAVLKGLCLVNGMALFAVGASELAYQPYPEGSWVSPAHSYATVVPDCAEWQGFAFFIGYNAGTPAWDILRYTPGGSVTVYQAGVAGTGGGDNTAFLRLTTGPDGLYFFHRKAGVSATNWQAYIGRAAVSGISLEYCNIGFMQDYLGPVGLGCIFPVGLDMYYTVDATPEFIGGGDLEPTNGTLNRVASPTATEFLPEWSDGTNATNCAESAIPIGPIETVFA